MKDGEFLPRLISWNTTYECNLRCEHCYIDAVLPGNAPPGELSTGEAFKLIDDIASFSKPILILSGGEPLLRKDIYDIASYGSSKGLRIVMGTNGTLIDDEVVERLKDAGVMRVGISIDALTPSIHDHFRGVEGAHHAAIEGAKACKRGGLSFQIHTTITRDNYQEIPDMMDFVLDLGADAFHLFFLVPTGRGEDLVDVTPQQYEDMLVFLYERSQSFPIELKAVCAPQFMRIAMERGGKDDPQLKRFTKGCLAATAYCRIKPDGEVNPCPYLPVNVGNVRDTSFEIIWKESKVLNELRNPDLLEGGCGSCRYRTICGGCRARAYAINGSYLAEEPWCVYADRL
ncbi:MAG: radical SAM protein [Candidatus Syntrophoarchaeum butanivorans]|uniref:Radical SAM protein n=2 Tax=Candidatus Syntropharchaeum butanivorans TaxID=1839936 RepID=A0A1F2P6V6_9EURY|nr:MAG: radical SAM protein [Candidatus Syntrophoarchaeum butanivorans]